MEWFSVDIVRMVHLNVFRLANSLVSQFEWFFFRHLLHSLFFSTANTCCSLMFVVVCAQVCFFSWAPRSKTFSDFKASSALSLGSVNKLSWTNVFFMFDTNTKIS